MNHAILFSEFSSLKALSSKTCRVALLQNINYSYIQTGSSHTQKKFNGDLDCLSYNVPLDLDQRSKDNVWILKEIRPFQIVKVGLHVVVSMFPYL